MSQTDIPTENKGYDYSIDCSPDYSFVTVEVPSGESINVESSAMAW